jgi:hypothetical protein
MDAAEKLAVLNTTLERAADQLGDITAPVMALYYQRFPQSLERFEQLWPGKRAELEGEMVERVLYCLMVWFESPGEIEIMLSGSVLHHSDTLHVGPDWFAGFLDAAADVIAGTIPAECSDEHAVWEELRRDLLSLIEQSGRYVQPRRAPPPFEGSSSPASP